jgi:MFS family permease
MNKRLRVLLLCNFANLFAFSLFLPLYAIFALNIGASASTISYLYAANTMGTAIMVFFFGYTADRLRVRPVVFVIAGYFIMAAGAFAYLAVTDVKSLLAVQLFNAVGSGLMVPAWKTSFSKLVDRGSEGSEWSLYDGGSMLMTSLGAAAGGWVISHHSFQTMFILIGTMEMLAAVAAYALLKSTPKTRRR